MPECSKASLLTQVGVKESAALIVKAPVRGGQMAHALNPELSQRFQQSSCTGHMREVITEYVITSLIWPVQLLCTEYVICWCTVLWLVR